MLFQFFQKKSIISYYYSKLLMHCQLLLIFKAFGFGWVCSLYIPCFVVDKPGFGRVRSSIFLDWVKGLTCLWIFEGVYSLVLTNKQQGFMVHLSSNFVQNGSTFWSKLCCTTITKYVVLFISLWLGQILLQRKLAFSRKKICGKVRKKLFWLH